jgi:hypothetical protein
MAEASGGRGPAPADHPRGFLARLFQRFTETDEERLAAETREWAREMAGCASIAEAPSRRRVRLAGVVRRITVRPVEGGESVEAVLSDGTGEVSVQWMGRRSIPGMSLGTRIVVEGVLGDQPKSDRKKMVNPRFEFAG